MLILLHCFLLKLTKNSLARLDLYGIAAVAWTLLIAVLCLVSFKQLPSIGIGGADKYVHATFHFIFTGLWFLYFRKHGPVYKVLWRVAIVSFLYGIIIEIAQELFTTTRHADIYDVAANTTGTFAAITIIMVYEACKKRN